MTQKFDSKATSDKTGTGTVRIAIDLCVKLAAVTRHDYVSTAEVLDPAIRRLIEKRFDALPASMRERVLAQLAEVPTP